MNPLLVPRCCLHCGNTTGHELPFEYSAPQTIYDLNDGEPWNYPDDPKLDYAILRCTTCDDITLCSKLDCLSWDHPTFHYPSDYDLDGCVPEPVRTNYREAKTVKKMSPNAFAVLLRRALEALCDDRGVSEGSLASRLRKLAANGEIPGKLADLSSVLRELSNAGAHHTSQKVTVPLTWTMDQFFRTVVEYVYVAPDKLTKFQEQLVRYERARKRAEANQD